MAQRSVRALWFVHGAVLLFGLAGVLGKAILLPVTIIVLGRVVFGALALGGLLRARGALRLPGGARAIGSLALSGAILAVHWTTFFQSVQVSTVAIALLSYSTFPLFTTALEPLLLHDRPRRLDVLAALAVLPGVYLIVPTLSVSNSTTQGVLWGLAAGATFALLSIWNRLLTRRFPSAVIGFYQETAAAIILLPTLVFFRPVTGITLRDVVLLIILGVFCTALAHTMFIEGMRTMSAQTASVIAALEPAWGILFALLLLDEIPTWRTLLGGGCIVLATLIPALGRPRQGPTPSGRAKADGYSPRFAKGQRSTGSES